MKLSKAVYEKKLSELQTELVKLQEWIIEKDLKVVVIFEGRDAAGKGGVPLKGLLNRLIRGIVKLSLCQNRQKKNELNGIFSATLLICQVQANWCCLTEAGTIVQV